MTRKSIGSVLLWLTRRLEPDLQSRCPPIWKSLTLVVAPVSPSPRLTSTALIDAYAAPTPASDKRGEYLAARCMAAIAQLRAELDQHERALRAMALGSPDLGLSRMVGAIRDVQQAIAGLRAKIQQLQTEGQGA